MVSLLGVYLDGKDEFNFFANLGLFGGTYYKHRPHAYN